MDALEFIDRQLQVTVRRIAEATDLARHPFSHERERDWLAECARREQDIDAMATPDNWPIVHLALSASETRVLWVLLAQELVPAARERLRLLATEDSVDISHDVLRRVVYGHRPHAAGWRELSSSGALLRHRLVHVLDAEAVPTHRMAYRVARRVLAIAHGDHSTDPELAGLVTLPDAMPPLAQLTCDDSVRTRICEHVGAAAGLVVVAGPSGSGRRTLLVAATRLAGRDVLAVDAKQFPVGLAEAQHQLAVLKRECRLARRVPLILNLDALAEDGEPAEPSDRMAAAESVLDGEFVLATASHPIARRWKRPPRVVELPPLTGAQHAELWKRALPEASDGDAALLSTLYPLAPALIDAVSHVARDQARGRSIEPTDISVGLRRVLDDRLAGLATRVEVTQEWSDLVLPDDQTIAIVELLARLRARRRVYEDWGFARKLGKGLGMTAMFSGPPGTGKTMCAGLVAKDLGNELYQVDLGKVVSKWLGETEKNLGALFEAAEASHAVLLFDEADSLFGKRTNVSSSHDRHANRETNFLLQRIERFGGICILTTNHDTAIDEAFMRRLSVRIRFPFPDENERARLWKAMIPADAPIVPELGLATLARKYTMTGGHIRNAVVRAAFFAADANVPIGEHHLRQAAQLEYEAMGKL